MNQPNYVEMYGNPAPRYFAQMPYNNPSYQLYDYDQPFFYEPVYTDTSMPGKTLISPLVSLNLNNFCSGQPWFQEISFQICIRPIQAYGRKNPFIFQVKDC